MNKQPWPTYLPLTTLIPITLDFLFKRPSSKELNSSLWWATLLSVFIMFVFYRNAMSACDKKEEYIQRLEPDAKKYHDQRDTEFNQLKEDVKVLKAKQAENEYKDKHSSIHPLNSKID